MFEELTQLEKQAIETIYHNDGELLQSSLSDEINCSVSKSSDIARKLEENDIIDREQTVVNGSRTYNLVMNKREISKLYRDEDNIDYSLLLAGNILAPNTTATNPISPQDERLTEWIFNLEEDDK